PVDEVQVDHGLSAVRLALGAGVHAALAPDATRGVHVELVAVHQETTRSGTRFGARWDAPGTAPPAAHSGGPSALRRRQADTLYSGILLRGSRVRCVRRFA